MVRSLAVFSFNSCSQPASTGSRPSGLFFISFNLGMLHLWAIYDGAAMLATGRGCLTGRVGLG
jgi:hypothetical protein